MIKAHVESPSLRTAGLTPKDLDYGEADLIPTLNQQGYMLTTLHEYSQAFVDFAPHAPGPLLDVGTAYGFNILSALSKASDVTVIANDLDTRHLEILKQCIPPQLLSRVHLQPGRIPGEVSFAPESLGAVLASGVFQFLPGEELIQAVQDIYRWLKPGGKFFFASSTPYCKAFDAFRPIYRNNKRKGLRWPGYIKDTSVYLPEIHNEIPPLINLIDQEIMEKILLETGFHIEKMDLFNIPSVARGVVSHGDEILGGIVVKK